MNLKFLISGFVPFGKNLTNPTQVILKDFQTQNPSVETVILPVSFKKAYQELSHKVELFEPDILIMCGLAHKRSSITLETQAINFTNAKISDNDGYAPQNQTIVPEAPMTILSDFNCESLKMALERKSHSIELSESAGSYVCNDLYYKVLANEKRSYKAIFIHFPQATDNSLILKFKLFLEDLIEEMDLPPL